MIWHLSLNQRWLRFMTPYCLTRAQWVDVAFIQWRHSRDIYRIIISDINRKINFTFIQWYHYGDVIMSAIASKTQVSRLFTQPFIQTQIKERSKLCVTGLCVGNSPGTGEFPAQMASNAENVSIWWRHHVISWMSHEPMMAATSLLNPKDIQLSVYLL